MSIDEAYAELMRAAAQHAGASLAEGLAEGVRMCSVAKAAKVFGIGPKRVAAGIASHEIATFCDGKVFLDDVEAWIRDKQRDARSSRLRLAR